MGSVRETLLIIVDLQLLIKCWTLFNVDFSQLCQNLYIRVLLAQLLVYRKRTTSEKFKESSSSLILTLRSKSLGAFTSALMNVMIVTCVHIRIDVCDARLL